MKVHGGRPVSSGGSSSLTGASYATFCPEMYTDPPTQRVTMDYFEQSAFDRLQLLNSLDSMDISSASSSSSSSSGAQIAADQIYRRCEELGLNDQLKDRYSHFTLRLAFCANEESRRWFVRMESKLFRYRFEYCGPQQKSDFLRTSGFNMHNVSDAERATLDNFVMSSAAGNYHQQMLYKVPFEQALDLISMRKVFLKDGFAYVWFQDVVSIVTGEFRAHLSKCLAATFRSSHHLKGGQDQRIEPLLKVLMSNQLQDRTYGYTASNSSSGSVSAGAVSQLAKESFPLCMLHLQQSLKRDHHLRYQGRQQFGLFLKGIGLSLEESLKFWRESFSGRVPREKFDKEYAYNIRYNYGKEGKRTDYTPYSCSRIVNGTAPGQGEHHGCPFKNFDAVHLREKLASVGLPSNHPSTKEILDLTNRGHFQVACQRYFVAMHPGAIPEKVGMHPNAYFDESRNFITARSDSPEGGASAEDQTQADSQMTDNITQQ